MLICHFGLGEGGWVALTRAHFQENIFWHFFGLSHTQDKHGRKLIDPFLELPSAHRYADYYRVIEQPLAMSIIEARLWGGTYPSLAAYVVRPRGPLRECVFVCVLGAG